ncbi:MAG: OmpH family outer membrane protein [Proteobacteria bacterium]|jgi:outer membrane protein|nr:OmpH family outer membrane protein [Pseudomonadota bacterium]
MKLFYKVLPLFIALPLFAGVKIGTVDLQQALQESQSGKKAKEALEKEFNTRKSTIDKERTAFEKLQEDLQKSAALLSKEARGKKEAEMQQKAMNLQKMVQDSEMTMRQKEAEMTKPIIEGLRELLPDLSRKRGVDLVVEKNAGLLYAVDISDMTEELIRLYDEKNKKKK